jgi:hypothetical protein
LRRCHKSHPRSPRTKIVQSAIAIRYHVLLKSSLFFDTTGVVGVPFGGVTVGRVTATEATGAVMIGELGAVVSGGTVTTGCVDGGTVRTGTFGAKALDPRLLVVVGVFVVVAVERVLATIWRLLSAMTHLVPIFPPSSKKVILMLPVFHPIERIPSTLYSFVWVL